MRTKLYIGTLALATIAIMTLSVPLRAQAPAPDMETLAKDPNYFIQVLGKAMKWEEPAEPMKIAGPIYFVGTKGLGVWLITGSEGHILLNTGMPSSGPMIEASVRKLGFKPEDIKLLLTCHAHIDHVGGHAYIKRISGAQVAMMDVEKNLLESGGKLDFFYAGYEKFAFEPVKVDRVFKDGEIIKLGDVAITARLTPGHSKGATTYITKIVEGGREYIVVFPDGFGVNPGYRIATRPSYPGIGDDYRRTFNVLQELKADIWLPAHMEVLDLERRRADAATKGVQAWVDPEGYRQLVSSYREKFEKQVDDERREKP